MLASKAEVQMSEGDIFSIETPGGGGFGTSHSGTSKDRDITTIEIVADVAKSTSVD